MLERKALQLTGGPSSPKAPAGRGTHPAAQAFADALLDPSAHAVFARYGFGSP
jgi:hypothetical protein